MLKGGSQKVWGSVYAAVALSFSHIEVCVGGGGHKMFPLSKKIPKTMVIDKLGPLFRSMHSGIIFLVY